MPSEAPPSSADFTTSCTWRESVEVNTLTSSGITAPARVPHEMIVANCHQSELLPASTGIIRYETRYVSAIETIEVIQTREVSGASKFMSAALAYRALAMAALRKYEAALEMSIMMRITKIQTKS